MGWSTLPEPGKVVDGCEVGPCVDACQHIDCAAVRADAASACVSCGEPIGYEVGYYRVDSGLQHFTCAYDEATSGA